MEFKSRMSNLKDQLFSLAHSLLSLTMSICHIFALIRLISSHQVVKYFHLSIALNYSFKVTVLFVHLYFILLLNFISNRKNVRFTPLYPLNNLSN